MNPEAIRSIKFAGYCVDQSQTQLNVSKETWIDRHMRSYHLMEAIRWLKDARTHVGEADLHLGQRPTLKPLRFRNVMAKGGRA